MKIDRENLIKIVREEALNKYVRNNMSDIKNLIERGSVVEQTGLLRGPDVGSFQELLLSKLGLNSSSLASSAGESDFRDNLMDGNAIYNRPASDASSPEYISARNTFTSEMSQQILGQYTHKLWEMWVSTNYDASNDKLVDIVKIPVVQDWIREEIGGQALVPPVGSVQNAWESAARSLGYDITATRGSIAGVRAAIQFISDIGTWGGFSVDTFAEIQLDAEERASKDADSDADASLEGQPVSGASISRLTLPDLDVTRRSGETDAAYNSRKAAYQGRIDTQFKKALMTLGLNTGRLDNVNVSLSNIVLFSGRASWSSRARLLIEPPRVVTSTRGSLVTIARGVHPVIKNSANIAALATEVKKMFDGDILSATDTKSGSYFSLTHIIKWLGGEKGGAAQDAGAQIGGGALSKHGRVGVMDGDGTIRDALAVFYSNFSSAGGLRKMIVEADIDYVRGSKSENTKFKKPLMALMASLSSDAEMAGQAPNTLPGDVKKNSWDANKAIAYTNKVREHLKTLNESIIKELETILENSIKESFGVNKFIIPRTSSTESLEPAAPIQSPTTAFKRGFQDDLDTVGKIQRLLGVGVTGRWNPVTDAAFYYYINNSFRGPEVLKRIAGSQSWLETSGLSLASRSGLTSGPIGAYNFLTSTKWFPSQKKRIKRHMKDERKISGDK